ncbi:MAG TPA: DUF6492 family protein [Stellaceae bacterium]|jgi:hypothetical protein|nr:DUF6492 family protein [Stellaceae bacterium]
MTQISAILPIKTKGRHYADNIGRCDILFSSLRHFTTPKTFDRFLIIVPHDEYEDMKGYAKAWSDFPIEIIDEAQHMAVFGEFNQRHQIRGWHRQQIIKLYTPALIDTEYFMVFDPDCFATHPFTADSLIIDGKALTYRLPRMTEPYYWRASAKLLGVDPHVERDGVWWTPTILSRTLCLGVQRRLEEVNGMEWRRVLLSHYMTDWTEYTLYWLNAEREGLIDTYHTGPRPGARALHADKSVWFADKMQGWSADHYFSPDTDGMFAVVQSNTHISPEQVVHKLGKYFPITIQPYQRHIDVKLRSAEIYSAIVRRGLKALHKLGVR